MKSIKIKSCSQCDKRQHWTCKEIVRLAGLKGKRVLGEIYTDLTKIFPDCPLDDYPEPKTEWFQIDYHFLIIGKEYWTLDPDNNVDRGILTKLSDAYFFTNGKKFIGNAVMYAVIKPPELPEPPW